MEHYKPISNPPPGDHMTRNQGREKGLTLRRNAKPSGYLINRNSHEPYYLYPPEAFRPKTPPTEKQLAALAAGRELLGSSACQIEGCENRCYDDWYTGKRSRYCTDCDNRRRRSYTRETARSWLETEPFFLDTETTGLDESAEIVEFALIDSQGNT